ncbi:Uncharacterized protein APZ42_020843 [Daphnia magna]|uniref:Uncharacterized protein n=1 Tax=Daphnia magna TaxID=35525 RepID=A0A0P6FZH1_9CRUS|nr:Uncharacterized protein APZ42_020843 [Daphnia magna]
MAASLGQLLTPFFLLLSVFSMAPTKKEKNRIDALSSNPLPWWICEAEKRTMQVN